MEENNLLTPWLEEQILNGEALLFLGAGATRGARGLKGEEAMDAIALRDFLADKFLGGRRKDRSLAEVAEYAKNEASLYEVQAEVSSVFEPLQPAYFHKLIPEFRWHAVITTNFDFIVERAYEQCSKPLQQLTKIIRDGDAADIPLGEATLVPFLKLHGCLSAINGPDLPLILSSEEYASHKNGRYSLFDMFSGWAKSRPIIFCGYNIGDPNIQQILFNLGDKSINRPHYAVVNPNLDDLDMRYWQTRRILPIKRTFEDFICELNNQIPKQQRILSTLRTPNASSIQPKIVRGQPSEKLLVYLENELIHVREEMPVIQIEPKDFFQGKGSSWLPIIEGLDIERHITDDILIDAVLEAPQNNRFEIYLVTGHAGSGKSITLRRVAWNTAIKYDKPTFWLEETGTLRTTEIQELYNLINERIFVFIEDLVPYIRDIESLIQTAASERIPVTVFLGARTNEWNIVGENLEANITENYELRRLGTSEINQLLESLERHNCLGHLKTLPQEDRIKYFELTADRQLLVALHEATSGKSFEEIIIDEFKNVVPRDAQLLYLDVCTFHRFKVGIRAGLVSRISGITLQDFNNNLFKPLEHVVDVYFDRSSRDYAYRSRHSVIADIVFGKVLDNPEDRADQLIRLLQSMNVDFQSDHLVFEQIIKGRDLASLFDDRALAYMVFDAASRAIASQTHIQHQRAVFELNHPMGDLKRAFQAVKKAEDTTSNEKNAISHTKAMVLRRMAFNAQSVTERDKLREEAKEILARLIKRSKSSHAYHTLGQLYLDECRDYADELESLEQNTKNLRERQIVSLVSKVERSIQNGLKAYPGESYLLELQVQLAKFIQDEPRAEKALIQAIGVNPGNGFLAVRVAQHYREKDDLQKAERVLVQCLELNPSSVDARVELAKLLIKIDAKVNHDQICDHLGRVFSTGDTNYEAQFWFARQHFLYGDLSVAEERFNNLKTTRISPKVKQERRGKVLNETGQPVVFQGKVQSKLENFCFVSTQSLKGNVFMHAGSISESQWESIKVQSRIEFELAFTFRGPIGLPGRVVP